MKYKKHKIMCIITRL